jgi:hypothetical protein
VSDGSGRPRRQQTWPHPGPGGWRPLGVFQAPGDCGCWIDGYRDGELWEPCMAHEGEGHLSAISPDQDGGVTVARCLVRTCGWRESWAQEGWAVAAAQKHWQETRAAHEHAHV